MTTEHWEGVDWEAAVRRGRCRDAVSVLPIIGWVAGFVLLNRHWVAAARAPEIALVAGVGTGIVVLVTRLALGRASTTSYRMQHAIRAHIDPGPELRATTDQLALRRSVRWYLWGVPFAVVDVFLRGRWDTPSLALPGAVLLVVSGACVVLWARRFANAADRWVEDPPGPPREPDPSARESGRRELTLFLVGAGILLVALFVVAVVVG
jgi:hypothetical protein